MSAYIHVDFAGSREEAQAFISGDPLIKVSRRLGSNGITIGAVARTRGEEAVIRKELLAFGDWDEDSIAVKRHHKYANRN